MNAQRSGEKQRRRPFRVLRRLADELIGNRNVYARPQAQGCAERAERIARNWYLRDQMPLPLPDTGPLQQPEVLAVCERVLQEVNAAVAHQFRLPWQVLQNLIACQTDACRARFAAKHPRTVDAAIDAALRRYHDAAGKLQRLLERPA